MPLTIERLEGEWLNELAATEVNLDFRVRAIRVLLGELGLLSSPFKMILVSSGFSSGLVFIGLLELSSYLKVLLQVLPMGDWD